MPVGDRSGYEKGYVRCPDCQNLEIYWDGERVYYYQCAVLPVRMKVAEYRWRRCPFFRWRKGDRVFHRIYPSESSFIAFELEDKKFTDPKLIEFLREVIHSKERRRKRSTCKRIPKQVEYV